MPCNHLFWELVVILINNRQILCASNMIINFTHFKIMALFVEFFMIVVKYLKFSKTISIFETFLMFYFQNYYLNLFFIFIIQ